MKRKKKEKEKNQHQSEKKNKIRFCIYRSKNKELKITRDNSICIINMK